MVIKTKDPVEKIPTPIKGPRIRLTPEFTYPTWFNTAKDLLNQFAERTARRQLTVTAEGSLIPVTVGRDRVGASIADVWSNTSTLYVLAVWGRGPYEAIESVYFGSTGFSGTVRHYLGANVESLDTALAARGYTSNPADICFSVFEIDADYETDRFSLTAIVQGRNDIWDPRLDSGAGDYAYTSNPALVLGWFLTEFMGEAVDQDDLEACADWNDEVLGTLSGDAVADRGRYRHRIGLTFTRGASMIRTIPVLQEYAKVYIDRDGDTVRMVPDDHAASVATIGPGDFIADSASKEIVGLSRVPNQITVEYTDINSDTEWQNASYSTPAPVGVPVREQRVSMPGIQSRAQARRYANERLNKYTLARLSGSFEMRDDGLRFIRGDIVDFTDVEGASNKAIRILDVVETGKTQFRIDYREHDPAIKSSSIVPEPSVTDTNLPNPADIPDGPALTMTEALFVDEGGKTFSRWEIAWTGVAWPWAMAYRVRVKTGAQVVLETNISHLGAVAHLAVTAPIKQDLTYTAEVWVVNLFGKQGATAGTATATALGKLLLPTAPTNLRGFEAGQFVSLEWDAAIDIDLKGYRIKRIPKADYDGNVAGAWVHANAILMANRHDALRVLLNVQPVGTFVYMVKSLDSLDQESDSATAPYGRADTVINVTADQAGGVVLEELDAATVVNMRRFEAYGDAVYYVTDTGDAWTDDGSATDAWTDDGPGTDSWIKNQTAGASSLETDEWDLGVDKDANWTWNAQVTTFQGTVTQTTRFAKNADYPTFTDQGGTSFNGEARYMKALMECTGAAGDGMLIRIPVLASLQGNPLVETQTVSVPGAGSQPLAVTWTKDFVTPPKVTLTVIGNTFRQAAADNIDEDGCDLYAWDETATQAAATVEITARGV